MSPAAIAALLSIGVRVLDYFEAQGETLTDAELEARTVLRREMVEQAKNEGN